MVYRENMYAVRIWSLSIICLHVFEERNCLGTKVGIMQTLALERYTAGFCIGCEGNSMVYLIQ